jgi:acyl-CoA thioesterase-2
MSPLRAILDLDKLDGDRFVAIPVQTRLTRLFGGQVAAQALRAACHTVDATRPPHSLHGYFIRPGRPADAVHFEVEQEPVLPSVPPPEQSRTIPFTGLFGSSPPVEIRPVTPAEPGRFPRIHPFWVRPTEPVEADQASQACLLTYLSDIATLRAAQAPGSPVQLGSVSLDHSVWFHRPPSVDQWLLVSMDSVAHIGTRGLARGSIQTTDGTLVASIAQEALFRPAS